jgi:uncharacterized damage-inducible protein DinB
MGDPTRRLFSHMYWADHQLVALLHASPEARTPDVLRLFSHALAAERVWLLRLRGEESAAQPIWPEYTLDALTSLAAENASAYARLLEDAGRAPAGEIVYRNSQGVEFRSAVADVLLHVAVHGAYHRGQIAAAVRAAGGVPVNTDFITYARSIAPAAEFGADSATHAPAEEHP